MSIYGFLFCFCLYFSCGLLARSRTHGWNATAMAYACSRELFLDGYYKSIAFGSCRCPQGFVLQRPPYPLRFFTLLELGIDEIVKIAVQNGIDVRGFRAGPVILDHRVRLQDVGTDL